MQCGKRRQFGKFFASINANESSDHLEHKFEAFLIEFQNFNFSRQQGNIRFRMSGRICP
jgi:hypothetical protein